MARQKTSRAVIKHARLNPIHEKERMALEIIESLEKQNFSFKQIIVDAILRADGVKPEMFDDNDSYNRLLESLDAQEKRLERMIALAVQQIVKSRPMSEEFDEEEVNEDTEETSPFARRFARGFMQRQKSAEGKGA